MTSKKAKKISKSKAKPTAAEEQITAATTGSENEDTGTDVGDDDSEIEFMDNDEFHAALGTKRKFPDTDSDASTIAKKERSNGKGKGAS